MNSRIGNMVHYGIKHLGVKSVWMDRKHKNRRKYFKWFHKTEKAWKQYLKANNQLTPEDLEIVHNEMVKLIKN